MPKRRPDRNVTWPKDRFMFVGLHCRLIHFKTILRTELQILPSYFFFLLLHVFQAGFDCFCIYSDLRFAALHVYGNRPKSLFLQMRQDYNKSLCYCRRGRNMKYYYSYWRKIMVLTTWAEPSTALSQHSRNKLGQLSEFHQTFGF